MKGLSIIFPKDFQLCSGVVSFIEWSQLYTATEVCGILEDGTKLNQKHNRKPVPIRSTIPQNKMTDPTSGCGC